MISENNSSVKEIEIGRIKAKFGKSGELIIRIDYLSEKNVVILPEYTGPSSALDYLEEHYMDTSLWPGIVNYLVPLFEWLIFFERRGGCR